MSKSLKRVRAALAAAGVEAEVLHLPEGARTAADAARAAGCQLDQIAKSIMMAAPAGELILFLTAGGNRVDEARAAEVAGCDLARADAAAVRRQTGFAIGGVAPVGHLTPCPAFLDPRLLAFDVVWAAAGTPHHVFAIDPARLATIVDAQIIDFTTNSKIM